MSGPKVDIQWSPVDDDVFVTYGTSIQLFQAKDRDGSFHVSADDDTEPRVSTKIQQLASNTELPFMKCIAWCPRPQPKNVFAVAQASGRISIIGLGNDRSEDLVGKEFNVRFNRQCNYLAWNALETNLLAEGLERSRNEPCVLIWDVVNSVNVEVTERTTRHSFSEGPITKAYAELGSGESSSSFSWCPSDAKTFIVGMANKHLRLFDLRDINKPRLETHHKCVQGLCFEPIDRSKVASYADSHIAIWDLRSFDRPIYTITESKNVLKLSWCPTRSGTLSVLCKESSTIKLHDIRHSNLGLEDIEQASVERNIQPFGKSAMSSFAWHPTQENRMMTGLPNGSLRDMTLFERIPMEWSSSFQLLMPVRKDTLRCLEEDYTDGVDISAIMRKRVGLDYGLQSEQFSANFKAVEKEPHLHGLWRWIYYTRSLISQQEMRGSKHPTPAHTGVLSLLGFDSDSKVTMNSEPTPVQWKASEGAKYSKRTHYRSPQRSLALHLCGWVPDSPAENFESFINKLVDRGEPERAAAIALFYLHIKKALEILSSSTMRKVETNDDKPNLQAVAMALSGFTEDRNALWRRTCGTLRYQLDNPYLRTVFAFAACDQDDYDDVLNEIDLSVEDRVAFALNYLPDPKLKVYLSKLSEELIKEGDLDGILLTGMSEKGIDLLEHYMDRTCDVQTAAIAAVFSRSNAVMKDLRVMAWIESYRDLLDRWRCWHQRAQFDIVRQTLNQDFRPPPQMHLSCTFCGKAISNTQSLVSKARSMVNTTFRIPQNKNKISCCPSCRKALPRCAICLSHMGTLSGLVPESTNGVKVVPFADWFTWCNTCRHGGHASHLSQWFREHSDCPVTGCPCRCVAQDAVSRRVPHATNKALVDGLADT